MLKKLSRKGESETLWTAIYLILAGIVIVCIVALGVAIFKALTSPTDEEKASLTNFETLTSDINDLINSDQQFAVKRDIYYIGNNFELGGMDTDWRYDSTTYFLNTYADDGDNKASAANVLKPSYCNNKACLCLYKGGIDVQTPTSKGNNNNYVLKCITFESKNNPNNNIFFLTYDERNNVRKAKVIYGLHYSGNAWQAGFLLSKAATFMFIYGKSYGGSHDIYIEKYVDSLGVHILIMPIYEPLYARYASSREDELKNTCLYENDKSNEKICTGYKHDFILSAGTSCTTSLGICSYTNTDQKCNFKCLEFCKAGELIQDNCVCQLKAVNKNDNGYCADNAFIMCQTPSSKTPCSLYCGADGNCDSDESTACTNNPCGYATNECYIEKQTNINVCKDKPSA